MVCIKIRSLKMNLYELFQMWVNHPKKGSGRRNLDNTDECWKKVLQDNRNWESSEDKNDNDFAKYLLYTGKIRRVHLDLFDGIVKNTLPYFIPGLTVNRIDKWRVNFDYESFNECVEKLFDDNNIHIPFRRKFDHF